MRLVCKKWRLIFESDALSLEKSFIDCMFIVATNAGFQTYMPRVLAYLMQEQVIYLIEAEVVHSLIPGTKIEIRLVGSSFQLYFTYPEETDSDDVRIICTIPLSFRDDSWGKESALFYCKPAEFMCWMTRLEALGRFGKAVVNVRGTENRRQKTLSYALGAPDQIEPYTAWTLSKTWKTKLDDIRLLRYLTILPVE